MAYDTAFLGSPANTTSALTINNTAADGVYKLVQQVMVTLLKDSSSEFAMGEGTELPQQLVGANIMDESFLKGLFDIAADKVLEQLQASISYDVPDDEYPVSINVEPTGSEEDSMSIQVTVQARSGSSTTVNLPVESIPESTDV